jgi:carboxyl-terminal processing protease
VALVVGALLLLAVGLWFGGHPTWLPSPLRSAFVSESATQKLENQVYGLLSKDYFRPVNRTALVNDGLAAAVASLDDPYSHYYDPANYHTFTDTETNPTDSGGIGVVIEAPTKTGLEIGEVYPDTPAERAGIQTGDVITSADGHSFAGLTETQMADLVRGMAGTSVKLTVTEGSTVKHLDVERRNISVPVASSKLLTYHGTKVGYVDLTMFSENAGDEVRAQVDKMRAAGAQALILDLRDNGGGLVTQAVKTASIFIPSGTIVSTAGRAQPREVYMALGNAIPTSVPLVVLVNRDTASAAEIVTAALKQRGRATVVGTRTYGKGVFQEIAPLMNGGALDFTVGRYYTPDGENLGNGHGVQRGPGIKPDVYAITKPKAKVDTALRVAEKTVLSKLTQ